MTIENMKFLIEKAWSVLSFKITIDGFSFEIWQPFAYAIIIKVVLTMIMGDINWVFQYKINENRNEVMRNMKYTQWNKKLTRNMQYHQKKGLRK